MEAGEDLSTYENLLSEFKDVFSTFGVKNVNKLYHFLYIVLAYQQQLQNSFGQGVENIWKSLMTSPQQTAYASSSTENASMDIEISAPPEHQSQIISSVAQPEQEVIQIDEVSMLSPLKATAEPFTPKGKGGRKNAQRIRLRQFVLSLSLWSSGSSGRGAMEKKKKKIAPVSTLNTSRKAPKKQPATPAPKTISTIMTGYDPQIKDNIREITVYDIPSRWTQLDVLNHLKTWGQVIAIKFKSQQKYTTVSVSVDLNRAALDLWNGGAWTAPLGGVPASTTIASLYPDNPAQSILAPTGCKAFKLIQDRGTRKLITYYESWADLDKVIGKAFNLEEFTGDWKRYYTPNLQRRKTRNQKVNQDSDSKVSQKDTNTIKSDKKHKKTKRVKKADKSLDGIDKLTVLAEIRSMLRKLGVS
ncbi:hypothetical protein RhiirA4_464329 [Rhizophagus irregularis]|uniref:Uncharacterized protein n=1 Tax=Rhizophagus irregularis TaxID=588596 RepID=A0A2I1GQ05_9GLOM|nr:hypothetical protein RhiirA4_464329 [Rhizophagus irregularis]